MVVGAVVLGAMLVPAVAGAGVAHADTVDVASDVLFSASELSPRERELHQKMTAYVDNHFDGDARAAFNHFDRNHDGRLGRGELKGALKTIGVGNGFTRGMWADGILERLDTSGDRALSWPEIRSTMYA